MMVILQKKFHRLGVIKQGCQAPSENLASLIILFTAERFYKMLKYCTGTSLVSHTPFTDK